MTPPPQPPEITEDLVRVLLREQFPHLAELPLGLGARGWDCQVWRLGDTLAVRMPWATERADELLRNELTWLPALAARLPLPVPRPRSLGKPSARFPRTWMITTWVPGEPGDHVPATDGPATSAALAGFLRALHQPAPASAPTGHFGRGAPLAGAADGLPHGFAEAVGKGLLTEPDAVRAVWEDALAAPGWEGPPLWLHGDLHPANVVTTDGALSGVIDFGDLCAGDPACDLAGAWSILPDEALDAFLAAYAPDSALLRRARGWAVGRSIAALHIADAGEHGRPGGKTSWGPPARAALHRLLARD
ncbi:aminoglycoside phosphotransferase family protein [Streptomyces sp. NRRL F-5630]|uniref:aminoglycoside phosphotransferase family protein n=1 Tax=Streptomyces sp. NRRL F-5630 TaxID=1463864 RepID=UPI003D721AD3